MTHKKALDAARTLKEYCNDRERDACNNCIFRKLEPIEGCKGLYFECTLEREPFTYDIETADKNKIKMVGSC